MTQSAWGTSTAQESRLSVIGELTFVLLQVLPMAVLLLPRLTLTAPLFTRGPLISVALPISGVLVVLAIAAGTHRAISPAVAAATAMARVFPDIFGFLRFSG